MHRRQLFRYLIGGSLLSLTACQQPKQAYQETLAVFGTIVRLTLYARQQTQATQAFAAVNARFQAIHHEWHAWEKGGLVSKINDAISRHEPITIESSVADFIRRNQQLCQLSDGLFDPGIGKLIKLWGFHRNSYENNQAPPEHEVAELLAQQPTIMDIHWQENTLLCNNPSVQLDFGASGKAYALNAATQVLKQQGIDQAMIAIGGDIQVLGNKQNQPWRIGINDPNHDGQSLASLPLADGEAACSSGTYERFYTSQGKKVTHIIHPRTGQPITHNLHSTVIHADTLTAEVGALTQLIATQEQWPTLAEQLNVNQYYLMTAQNQTFISHDLAQKLNAKTRPEHT